MHTFIKSILLQRLKNIPHKQNQIYTFSIEIYLNNIIVIVISYVIYISIGTLVNNHNL